MHVGDVRAASGLECQVSWCISLVVTISKKTNVLMGNCALAIIGKLLRIYCYSCLDVAANVPLEFNSNFIAQIKTFVF